MFRVSGKFADGYTFSVNPVDAPTPHEALVKVTGDPAVTQRGQPVVFVTVKVLTGKNSKIRISDKPAKERKGGGRKRGTKTATAATPATPARR